MSRPASVALLIAASAVVVMAGSALAADPAPSPPPGTVYLAPASVSSDGQGQAAQHCGVQAGVGSTGYSAQPTKISGTGTSSPTCSTSSGGDTAPAANGQPATGSNTAARDLAGGGAGRAEARTNPAISGSLTPTPSVRSGSGSSGGLLWFALLLLLALLFLLIGFAAGRRRRAQAAA